MTDDAVTIVHPTAVPRGRWYYAAGHALRLASEGATLAVLCSILVYPRYVFSWIMVGGLAAFFGLTWVRRRVFFAAWAEVPGAFGRSAQRISGEDRRTPHAAALDYAVDGLKIAIACAAGTWIAWSGHVPISRAAGALAGLGTAVVLLVAASLARDLLDQRIPPRLDYVTLSATPALGAIAWVAFAVAIDPFSARAWTINAALLTVVVMILRLFADAAWRSLLARRGSRTPKLKPVALAPVEASTTKSTLPTGSPPSSPLPSPSSSP